MGQIKMKSKGIKTTATTAIFTAIIAVCSLIAIPTPFSVPITLQTFAVALSGFFLKAKYSAAAVGAYILLGAVGLPIFSSFTGGIGVILGPTGGFLMGFLAVAVFCGLSAKVKSMTAKLFLPLIGLIICHLSGILWFSFVTGGGILASFISASLPFIIKDALLLLAAFHLSKRLSLSIYQSR